MTLLEAWIYTYFLIFAPNHNLECKLEQPRSYYWKSRPDADLPIKYLIVLIEQLDMFSYIFCVSLY